MSSRNEKQAMSRKIFVIELFILGILLALIMWCQGYLFCPKAAAKRMAAIYQLHMLYLQHGIWGIIKIIWWASGLTATIVIYLSYIAGEFAESLFSGRKREVSLEHK